MRFLDRMATWKKTLLGIFLIVMPWILVAVGVVGYVIEMYTAGAVPCQEVFYADMQDVRYECANRISHDLPYVIYGAIGVFGAVGVIIGNPFGVYLLYRALGGEGVGSGK